MEKKELEQYCKLKREINNLWKRLDKLREKDVPVVAGKVQASDKDWPYTERRIGVQMYEPKINDEINRTIDLLEERITRCNEQALKIEQYIDAIEDSELRVIFQMRYIDGKKLREIAKEVNLDLSVVGKKITNYLQFAKNAKKTVI